MFDWFVKVRTRLSNAFCAGCMLESDKALRVDVFSPAGFREEWGGTVVVPANDLSQEGRHPYPVVVPDQSTIVLQHVTFPADRALADLYFRIDDDRAEQANPRRIGRNYVVLSRKARLITDTYFNLFQERRWLALTHHTAFTLHFKLTGRVVLRVLRYAQGKTVELIVDREITGRNRTIAVDIPAPSVAPAGGGALALNFEVLSPTATIAGLEWHGNAVRQHQATSVAICICTHNRQDRILENIKGLLRDRECRALGLEVIVVDHSDTAILRQRLAEVPDAHDRVKYVRQINLGGAGGFGRAISEARKEGRYSHVILMDDDVVIEPEAIYRAVLFTAAARTPFAIAGQVLDLFKRQMLFEAGAAVRATTMAVGIRHHQVDVGSQEGVLKVQPPHEVHYGAWCFFCFCPGATDPSMLPMPLFIRGDDVEFGLRLRRDGIATESIPGIAVWHEPIQVKGETWQRYYDLRNMMILTSIHFSVKGRKVRREIFRRTLRSLLQYDYAGASLWMMAARDYLVGPDLLKQDPATMHRGVLAAAATPQYASEAMLPRESEHKLEQRGRVRQFLMQLLHLAMHLRRSPRSASYLTFVPVVMRSDCTPARIAGYKAYLLKNEITGRLELRQRDTGRFWSLLGRALGLHVELWLSFPRVRRQWRRAASDLSSAATWAAFWEQDGALLQEEALREAAE
jgi:galactofuranosylgalactofuranosylrhamnosyl-N-acetylglucosaminyl-diphospho-decaprenol beta-1,5/1,6-galactofuranosyltransferase